MSQKKIPQKKDLKDERLNKLQRRVKRLEKENAILKSEIKTLEAYREKTNKYIDGELDGIPVEDAALDLLKAIYLRRYWITLGGPWFQLISRIGNLSENITYYGSAANYKT